MVGADVGEFVREGLRRLGVGDAVADADGSGREVGVPVRLSAIATFDGVPVGGDRGSEPLDQVTGRGSSQLGRPDSGKRTPVGLGQVEDVDDAEPAQLGVPVGASGSRTAPASAGSGFAR